MSMKHAVDGFLESKYDATDPIAVKIKKALQCPGPVTCRHCEEVSSLRMDGERYECKRCGDSYFLDYEEIR